jgi:hypothetical protein
MSSYNQEFNKDNVILRYIIVSLLAELKDKVYYFNRIDEDTLQKINVPFYYSITGNERFLLDNFLFDAIEEGKAIGDYEVVPRGVITLTSIAIDTGSMTNKFVRSEFVKEYEGQLKTYMLETMFLPLDMTFNVTVICSSNLEMLKVTESILSKLYKATLYQVDLGMFRIESSLQVPEDYSQERPFEFALNDKKEFQVTFDIQVKTFMPVFENGILLNEIEQMTRNSLINPNNNGIGLFRNGNLYFGGVYQEFNYTINDEKYSPDNNQLSNITYTDPATLENGGLFLENNITTEMPMTEQSESKEYRNAE